MKRILWCIVFFILLIPMFIKIAFWTVKNFLLRKDNKRRKMKIVIDMTEDFYKLLMDKEFDKIRDINLEYIDLVQKIKNGTILPKNHGRLIDADVVYRNAEEVYYSSEEKDIITPEQMYSLRSWLNSAPTIIEADKEEQR